MKPALFLIVALAGCVTPSHELRRPVDRLVGERMASAPGNLIDADRAAIGALLARPLDTAAAIRVALATNPQLRVALDQLDIAAAEVAAALGLGPVAIDANVRFGTHREVELDAIQSLLGLISAPGRRAAATADLAAARASAAASALRLVARVEIAFGDLFAARQDLALRQAAFDAADVAATLRERMHAAGNASDLALARDVDAREMARLELTRAEASAAMRREAAGALLGLSGARTWSAEGTLRDLPAAPPALDDLETTATTSSLDLAAGRDRREAAEHRVSDEWLRTFVPELGAGVSIADDGHATGIGPAVRIGLPLFDPRSGERARARALARRAEHELESERIALGAAAGAARTTALATYREARHLHDVILPLRQRIVDETIKHYNAMDADPFALIAARQGLVEANHQYLDAVRRYWNAMAEVTALTRGATPAAATEQAPRSAPSSATEEPR